MITTIDQGGSCNNISLSNVRIGHSSRPQTRRQVVPPLGHQQDVLGQGVEYGYQVGSVLGTMYVFPNKMHEQRAGPRELFVLEMQILCTGITEVLDTNTCIHHA